jgi:hypothetical protein
MPSAWSTPWPCPRKDLFEPCQLEIIDIVESIPARLFSVSVFTDTAVATPTEGQDKEAVNSADKGLRASTGKAYQAEGKHCGRPERHWRTRSGQQENARQDAQKCRQESRET